MKNLSILFALICGFQVMAQRQPKIKGNRNVVIVEDVLPFFDTIELRDDLKITIVQAEEPGYFIEADDNLIDILKFKVTGNTLEISSFYKVTSKKKLDIIIRFTELAGVVVRDGEILLRDKYVSSGDLNIHTTENAKLELLARATNVSITMDGKSDAELNIEADSLSVNLADKVSGRLYTVANTTTVEMRSGSDLRIEGTSEELSVNLFESANYKGSKMEGSSVKLEAEGNTSADINAINSLDLSARGSSKTHFYGNAALTVSSFLDKAQINKE